MDETIKEHSLGIEQTRVMVRFKLIQIGKLVLLWLKRWMLASWNDWHSWCRPDVDSPFFLSNSFPVLFWAALSLEKMLPESLVPKKRFWLLKSNWKSQKSFENLANTFVFVSLCVCVCLIFAFSPWDRGWKSQADYRNVKI